jgi:hypothetical protein
MGFAFEKRSGEARLCPFQRQLVETSDHGFQNPRGRLAARIPTRQRSE